MAALFWRARFAGGDSRGPSGVAAWQDACRRRGQRGAWWAWICASMTFDIALAARSHGLRLSVHGALIGPALDAVVTETVTYAHALKADVYRPHTLASGAPAVVVVHGGAWGGGDKS